MIGHMPQTFRDAYLAKIANLAPSHRNWPGFSDEPLSFFRGGRLQPKTSEQDEYHPSR
jgi:hypothetical protein